MSTDDEAAASDAAIARFIEAWNHTEGDRRDRVRALLALFSDRNPTLLLIGPLTNSEAVLTGEDEIAAFATRYMRLRASIAPHRVSLDDSGRITSITMTFGADDAEAFVAESTMEALGGQPVTGEARVGERTPAEVFFDAVQKRLDVQLDLADAIDARVATSFGIASTILPVTVGLLNLRQTDLDLWGQIFLVAAFVTYGLVIGCTYFAYHQRTLDYRPNVEDLARHAGVILPQADGQATGQARTAALGAAYTGDELHLWVATERAHAIRSNQAATSEKARWGKWAIRCLFAEAVTLSLAALATVF